MKSNQLRKKFLDFFAKQGHKIVPSSSLLPADPSVLFTTAGMQQFKPYYLGEKSPYGNRAASCQKCFRTSDIDEVGDNRHLTFLEMLGNFSFNDYFKKEATEWAYEFIAKELGLEIDYVSVFSGDDEVSEDKESEKIWLDLGMPKDKIKKLGREDNFWGPTGEEGPCGPTTEIYVNGVEIWNLVFNEYYQDRNKKLTLLKQKGVDTGMGLERLAMVCQKKDSVFETDLFEPLISEIRKISQKDDSRAFRIIADHIKSSVFLASEGVFPSNVERGYVLRRILRRAIRYGKILELPSNHSTRAKLGAGQGFLIPLAKKVVEIYQDVYPEIKSAETDVLTIIQQEEEKFEKTLEKGIKEIEKAETIDGKTAFHIYETYGFPLELTEEIKKVENRDGFFEEMKRHQEISRAGVEAKFGGGGEFSPKLHTVTHLLHAALRQVLGPNVKQMGSDITAQRLRFDFSHPQKMTQEEIEKVEDIVNQKIKEDLEVKKEEMKYQDAIKSGALAFFKEKYPEKVSVYLIGSFSKEICAGPHVNRTSELGKFKITKEESSGAGVRRIRAVLE